MNPRLWPMLSINLMLILSIILLRNDALTIIMLFLVEIFISSVSGEIIEVKNAEKHSLYHGLSPRTKAVINNLFVICSVPVFIAIIGSIEGNPKIIWSVIYKNIWIVISIIVIEVFAMVKYFYDKDSSKRIFGYGYAKIFAVIILIYLIGPVYGFIESIFGFTYEGLPLLAVICVIGKTAVDYLIINTGVITS